MKKSLQFKKMMWKLMRLTFVQMFLLGVFATMAYANDTKAQDVLNKDVSLQAQSESIKTILAQIEKQTNVKFVYSDTRVQIDKKVSVDAKNQKLATVLQELLPPPQYPLSSIGQLYHFNKN